ncbi:MAG: hypothetical protein HON10_04645, partial [Euryarchaeota archaeon]|nr:hypothetical protein [Euryarchaeota archaeon]
ALEESEVAAHWNELFLESGGNDSVANEWLTAIDDCLNNMGFAAAHGESE